LTNPIDEIGKQAKRKHGTVIKGIPPIPCIFCDHTTSIQFDLDLHLYEEHRTELVKLPIGKGDMDYRINYAIEEGKRIRDALLKLTSKARDNLGIYGRYKTNIRVPVSSNQVNVGLEFVLSHLDEPLFPRTIMTEKLGRQMKVFDRGSAINHFKGSDYYDCRINAYSNLIQQDESMLFYTNEVEIVITIIVIDLDTKDFCNSKEKLDDILRKTIKKIKETIGGYPTVLNTGNGYHIYQPVKGIIFDEIKELNDFVPSYNKYFLSNKFLKFAEYYFTDGKSDPQHNPTVNSCLMRIPGTLNSKCGREVSIMQEWDYHKASVDPLLPAFKEHLASQLRMLSEFQDARVICSNNITSISKHNMYSWIDVLLQFQLADYRKFAIRRILAPYLIVIRQLPYGECFKIIYNWLVECNRVKPLCFDAKFIIEKNLQAAQRVGYKPIRLEKLQQENPLLYNTMLKIIRI
jgi:hypothetical protein